MQDINNTGTDAVPFTFLYNFFFKLNCHFIQLKIFCWLYFVYTNIIYVVLQKRKRELNMQNSV